MELTKKEISQSRKTIRRQKWKALFFVFPLLFFILLYFIAPIGTMLYRSVYQPTVAQLIPNTLTALASWDEQSDQRPSDEMIRIFALELQTLAKERTAGKFAAEINRFFPGASSTIKSSARQLKRIQAEQIQTAGEVILFKEKSHWKEVEIWRAIKRAGPIFTSDYYLTALDLTRTIDGNIESRETEIYLQLYGKTLKMALIITLLTIVISYPLSYYMTTVSAGTANFMMIFVLLPFWSSLLVRTTAWITLLQTNGIINSSLQGLNIINEPLDMIYNEFSTIITMTHILLPFMILPLYSVMRGIDPSYFRAALSMGAKPMNAFIRIYMPLTLPGVSAGVLLVFIVSVGYYITPALVGGTEGQMISNLIAFHMQTSNNWGLAAALGGILLVLILLLYWLYDRFVGVSNLKLG